jgi:hypothetical protein
MHAVKSRQLLAAPKVVIPTPATVPPATWAAAAQRRLVGGRRAPGDGRYLLWAS